MSGFTTPERSTAGSSRLRSSPSCSSAGRLPCGRRQLRPLRTPPYKQRVVAPAGARYGSFLGTGVDGKGQEPMISLIDRCRGPQTTCPFLLNDNECSFKLQRIAARDSNRLR
ncbi:hypothetical protein K466DRAFT_266344 [Polyporus arcularius HHB13444]|uniref:Uncharacterized protein n=1 Tax=Polyporus arcularius HHB13444 TaxID=1314778 RepID=A0A5C3PRP0_9APHY|nr:hypothetical protein K466DRAFT_266344 [Polyporus arcularius HHB13444]